MKKGHVVVAWVNSIREMCHTYHVLRDQIGTRVYPLDALDGRCGTGLPYVSNLIEAIDVWATMHKQPAPKGNPMRAVQLDLRDYKRRHRRDVLSHYELVQAA